MFKSIKIFDLFVVSFFVSKELKNSNSVSLLKELELMHIKKEEEFIDVLHKMCLRIFEFFKASDLRATFCAEHT